MTTVGLCVPQLGPHVTPRLVEDFVRTAEQMGFGSLWVQDHFLYALEQAGEYTASADTQPEVYQSVFQPTELLAALACWTTDVTIGSSILVGGNHWPVQLAARLATIDQLSGGRLVVGFGVGWSHEEHAAVGVDARTRGRRMDDFIPALLACWGDDPVEHHGEFFDVGRSIVRPKPVQSPRPRIMSGMWSEKGLARTAEWFDLWNPGSMPIPKVLETLEVINAQRPEGKAPVDAIYRFAVESTAGVKRSAEEVSERVAECAEAGLEGVIIETNFCSDIDSAEAWMRKLESLAPLVDAAALPAG